MRNVSIRIGRLHFGCLCWSIIAARLPTAQKPAAVSASPFLFRLPPDRRCLRVLGDKFCSGPERWGAKCPRVRHAVRTGGHFNSSLDTFTHARGAGGIPQPRILLTPICLKRSQSVETSAVLNAGTVRYLAAKLARRGHLDGEEGERLVRGGATAAARIRRGDPLDRRDRPRTEPQRASPVGVGGSRAPRPRPTPKSLPLRPATCPGRAFQP
jgi:hypothetical protein